MKGLGFGLVWFCRRPFSLSILAQFYHGQRIQKYQHLVSICTNISGNRRTPLFFFFFTRKTFFNIQRFIYEPTIHIRLNAPTFTGVDMYILLQMDPYRSRAIFFFSMPKNLTVLPFIDFGNHGVLNGAKPTSQCTNITFNTRVSIKFYFVFFHCHICFPSLTFFSSAWWAVAVI